MARLPLIDANHPEYYAELLSNGARTEPRCPPPEERQFYPDIPSILDLVADVSYCERGNVSATMASLTANRGTLETQLYIVFNRGLGDDGIHRCREHLETIFNKFRQATDRLPEDIDLVDLCKVIHEYSFDVFAYRVNKRKDRLSEIWGYIKQDLSARFEDKDLLALMVFFQDLDAIIEAVNDAKATKQFSSCSIRLILESYSYWTYRNLLPDILDAGDKPTLLDDVDKFLADGDHKVDFLLKRWAQKIMSFVISASRLFNLTQSSRLRKVILGKFSIEFLTSPRAAPYSCILSSEAIRAVINDTLTGSFLSADYKSARESFIDQLKGSSEVVSQFEPTVHAELAMVMAMVNGEIKRVFPYIGVSKLSCIMCSHFIRAFNEVMGQKITVRGSHGKAYPGWSWPILPNHDEELRAAFLTHLRQQLRHDFELHAGVHRRRSDSSVGSDGSDMELDPTQDDIEAIAIQEELEAVVEVVM